MNLNKHFLSLTTAVVIGAFSQTSSAVASGSCVTTYTTECEYMKDGVFEPPLVEVHTNQTGYFICEQSIVRNEWTWNTSGEPFDPDTIGWPQRETVFYNLFHVNRKASTTCS